MTKCLFVVSLQVGDIAQAAHFYRDVVGLPMVEHHGARPHFDLGGSYLVLLKGQVPKTGQVERFPRVAITVEDLDAHIEALRYNQVELPWGIEEDALSRWVMFHDLDGNLIELVQFL
jgi:catechol-2,3-dioxygenase